MTNRGFHFFLFPQSVLSEGEFRFFSYLFPELHLLQVLRPPTFPEWGSRQFSGWPAIRDQELLDAIRGSLEAFREFAAIHGEESSLASISHEYIAGEYSESRFQIQANLREKAPPMDVTAQAMPMEACVFLEMARDLDEREMELETGIAQVDRLESEFREILGISSEEELEDVLETVTPPLFSDRNLSYRLANRMAFWLRLFLCSKSLDEPPVLVSTSNEVVEEAVESLAKWLSLNGKALHFERHVLCQIPGPVVQRLRNGPTVTFTGLPLMEREAVVHLLLSLYEAPANRLHQGLVDAAGKACAEWLIDLGVGSGNDDSADLELSIVTFGGATVTDLWASLDRDGHQKTHRSAPESREPLMFMVAARKQEF